MRDVQERTGEAFELGERLTVLGRRLRPGEPAPPFALDCLADLMRRGVVPQQPRIDDLVPVPVA
jgi:hypothetical protein